MVTTDGLFWCAWHGTIGDLYSLAGTGMCDRGKVRLLESITTDSDYAFVLLASLLPLQRVAWGMQCTPRACTGVAEYLIGTACCCSYVLNVPAR